MTLPLRDYIYLGVTQSLCPDCLRLVPAKILDRGGRVYFRKRCPEHGVREDFVCSDAGWFDRNEHATPGKRPLRMGVEPARGCPFDCGLCTEHEQHTCVALLEINSACNLKCPVCFASSGPSGSHLSVEDCRRAIDALVAAEGEPEVLQLSGGEPTIHPQFFDVFEYACDRPIDYVLINTNGVRLANDRAFVERIAERRHRSEIYLQMDSLTAEHYPPLRGEPLLETKLRAVERCAEVGLNVTLVATVETGVNLDQVGPLIDFAARTPAVTAVSFQPTTYVGRHRWEGKENISDLLENRVTFPDIIHQLAEQCPETWQATDFSPLPCAHPNGHTLGYAYRKSGRLTPLARMIDLGEHLDLLAGGITFTRAKAREVVERLVGRGCCTQGYVGGFRAKADQSLLDVQSFSVAASQLTENFAPSPGPSPCRGGGHSVVAEEFFAKALSEELAPQDVLRITTTSFMDAYNFDVRQVMKSCVHFVLPSGHLIPFSAYNVLYRDGHVPLPAIT